MLPIPDTSLRQSGKNDNWPTSRSPIALCHIHDDDVNIVIHERDIRPLSSEIAALLAQGISANLYGSNTDLLRQLTSVLDPATYPKLTKDVALLLQRFAEVTYSKEQQLLFKVVDTNMCRRFHTDVNDLRMLCTYSGPGTQWLTNDNVNTKALSSRSENARIVRDEARIRQAGAGDVVLLKGSAYPGENTRAVVHRSPPVEASREQRLLLRIDTETTANIWT